MKLAAGTRVATTMCVLVAAALLACATAASSQGRPREAALNAHTVTLRAVGGFSLSRNFAQALSYFRGKVATGVRTDFDHAGCTAQIQKFRIRFWYLQDDLLQKATTRTCNHFKAIVVTGAGWHTRNGLSIGDSTARMRTLFPSVYNTHHRGGIWTSPPGSVQWDITITNGGGEQPALSASVIQGHVVALVVEMVGH
jgi:hypothetical protein